MNDLAVFLKRETDKLAAEYERIQARIREDPGTAGDQGEENWATILREWLPGYFHVVTKGRILGDQGIAGPQVDVLVLSPSYPRALLDKKLFLAGGVLAAFECKVTLRAEHLRSFFENAVRIRALRKPETGTLAREVRPAFIYGLLAHAHEWTAPNSKPSENIEKQICDLDKELVTAPAAMPDIVCVANLGQWSAHKFVLPYAAKPGRYDAQTPGNVWIVQTGFSHFLKDDKHQAAQFSPVGSFLSSLFHKLSWHDPQMRAMANHLQGAGMLGTGVGQARGWNPSDILSKEVAFRVATGRVTNGEPFGDWDMTSL